VFGRFSAARTEIDPVRDFAEMRRAQPPAEHREYAAKI
jgi:hypothetical protein